MKPVPAEIVEATWQDIAGMSETEGKQMVTQFNREQPYLLAFLMGIGADVLNQDEQQLLFCMGLAVWRMMARGAGKALAQAMPKELDRADETNTEVLQKLSRKGPGAFAREAAKLLREYNQFEALKYVLATLMEEVTEEEDGVRDEMKGFLFFTLKTVIDALDK